MRQSTRPLPDRKPPRFLREQFSTKASFSETKTIDIVQSKNNSDDEDTSGKLRTPRSILKTDNCPRRSCHSRNWGQIQKEEGTPKMISRFYWGGGGGDFVHDDISRIDTAL